ncbi:hypothetical protein QFC22_001577 [Naganishia vaughanmartiniae]|uniref:Uncharacterized protein n=1 Tax=Naganishia vaughanmartiniae TaxID=1424756 RepID=A0ACC2XIC8_9TREE|nr:hypothetical protein QFC22_001577 [Naganishia vaughanmartiniae]
MTARSCTPETPVKPFSTPFFQADADLSLEDRYAETRKTEFVVGSHMNMPAIAEEEEDEEYTTPGVGIIQGIYSSNAPAVEYYYAEDTTSGAHTVQDGYPHGGPLLRTNTTGGSDEHIGAGSYPYYHDDRTKNGFDGHDANVEHPDSIVMITEPLSGCYSEISRDGLTGQMSEQPVFDSSGPSWTAGSSSQTNPFAEEFDGYHMVPSHRETLPQPTPVTPSDDGKVRYYVDVGQDIKGPRSNATLDVDVLEAAAAANIRREEGLTQLFHVSDNMASVMNADKAALKVVPSSAVGQHAQ